MFEKDKGTKFALMYFNDTHGKVGKLPRLNTAIDEFRKTFDNKDTAAFVVTTGDNYIGKPGAKHDLWTETLNNHIKPDFNTLGNHEFDSTANYFAGIIKKLKAPFLETNIETTENKLFTELKNEGKIASSAIVKKNGQKYGFIGAAPIDLAEYKSSTETQGFNVLDFEKSKTAIQKEVEKLQNQGANKIILLSHMGYTADLLIARGFEKIKDPTALAKLQQEKSLQGITSLKGVKGINVIIGAHTHTELRGAIDLPKAREIRADQYLSDFEILNPDEKHRIVNLIMPYKKNTVLISQAGGENEYVGFVNLIFNKKGKIKRKSITNELKRVSSFAEDRNLVAVMEKILGKQENITTVKNPFIDPVRRDENAIQNMIADAILSKANAEKDSPKADLALVHGAIARGNLDGPISNWDIEHDLIGFTEPMFMVKLSEKDLVDTVNNTAIKTLVTKGKPVLMHPSSNMRYTISAEPKTLKDGSKLYVQDITLKDTNGKERKINLENPNKEKTFTVLLEEYFLHGDPKTGGKEGFSALTVEGSAEYIAGKIPKPDGIIKKYDWTDKSAFMDYLKENFKDKTVDFVPDGRINIVTASETAAFGALTLKQAV
ncbi:MAG: metallophosphoesterase [bacterium]